MSNFENKKIAILGLGTEGNSVVRYLAATGAKGIIFDEKNVEDLDPEFVITAKENGFEIKTHEFETLDLSDFDIIVRSPGVRLGLLSIQNALKKGVRVTSATKLFFENCEGKIIGVTGTKGKGTTSTLIYEILKKTGKSVFLGGNIGNPPLEFLSKITSDSFIVLELSSFQLQDLETSPHIAVLLMITSEHMDYHKNLEEYVDSKRNLLRFQNSNDFAIVNRDYPTSNESDILTEAQIYKVSREQEVERGCFVKDDVVWLKMNGKIEKVIDVKDVVLPGRHNLENVGAAILASFFAGADMSSIVPIVKSFEGLPYRLELIRTARGVRFYNDSFSTTPETAIAAIESFESPEILILGGSGKNSDFTELGKVIWEAKNIKAIIGVGEEWARIKDSIGSIPGHITIVEGLKNMREVVEKCSEIAELGDVVLLSPACASFDMFKNYKERGNMFNEAVRAL